MNSAITRFDCQAIIFDLDGTLIDSTEAIKRIWSQWGAHHGINHPDLLRVAVSMRTIEAVRLLAPHLDVDIETEYLESAEATELEEVTEVEGAGILLRSLPQGNWGIVTSITRRTAQAKLNHLDLPIPSVLVTADDVECGKPAPDGYLLAAECLRVAANRCVVIEDTPAGIQAGLAAGMTVIGLAMTYPVDQIQHATAIVAHLNDITVSVQDTEGEESMLKLFIPILPGILSFSTPRGSFGC